MRWFNNVKTAALLGALMALCIAVGYFVTGGRPHGLMFGFLFGVVGNVIAYFFSDRIALAAMGGREVSREEAPWLHDMVARLAERAGLPKPRVAICPQPAPNAFATGRNPAHALVAVTEGMLRFPPDELEGVLAHELAHVRHRDILISTVAAVLAGMISVVAHMLLWFGGGHSRDNENSNPLGAIGAIAMIVLAPLAAALIQMAISRQREFAADSYGGELCGNPLKLASALARLHSANERIPTKTNPAFHNLYIVAPFNGRGMLSLFMTHPPVEARIAALRAEAARLRGGQA